MTYPSHEEVSERVYQDTYEQVVDALAPFKIPHDLLDSVACEAAEAAVEAEMEPPEEESF